MGEAEAFADLSGPEVRCLQVEALIEELGAPFGRTSPSDKLEFRLVTEGEFQEAVEGVMRLTTAERFRELERVSKIAKLVNIVWARAGMYDRIAPELLGSA